MSAEFSYRVTSLRRAYREKDLAFSFTILMPEITHVFAELEVEAGLTKKGPEGPFLTHVPATLT